MLRIRIGFLYLVCMEDVTDGVVAIKVKPYKTGYNVKLIYPGGCEVNNHFQQRYLIYDWIDFLKIPKYEITWETESQD